DAVVCSITEERPANSEEDSSSNASGCIEEEVRLCRPGGHASRIHQGDIAGTQAGNQIGLFDTAYHVFIKVVALGRLLPRDLILKSLVVLAYGLVLLVKKDGPILVFDLL